eukprot:SAG22_NODE_285_length_12974_cov_2.969087_2_plen_911_part_00
MLECRADKCAPPDLSDYNGMLYLLGLLHVSGQFKIYANTSLPIPAPGPAPLPPPTPPTPAPPTPAPPSPSPPPAPPGPPGPTPAPGTLLEFARNGRCISHDAASGVVGFGGCFVRDKEESANLWTLGPSGVIRSATGTSPGQCVWPANGAPNAGIGFTLRACPSQDDPPQASDTSGSIVKGSSVLAWDAAAAQLKLVDDAGKSVGKCAGDHGGLLVQLCSAETTKHWSEKKTQMEFSPPSAGASPSRRFRDRAFGAGATSRQLTARLSPAVSTRPCTVLEIEQASVPAATTWFRLVSATPGVPVPTQMVGEDGGEAGLWFIRTARKAGDAGPKGIQQFPFLAAGMFNAGNVPEIVPANLSSSVARNSFAVEAWSDRNDMSDGAEAKLLSTSAAMEFSFDDGGFSANLKFDGFKVAASRAVPGLLTVSARPTNATAFGDAKLITWYSVTPADWADEASGLPTFRLATDLLGDMYTTREFPTPSANISLSGPGIHFVALYGAWNGEYGFSQPLPENGVRTFNSFPLDNISGTTFQPVAVVVPWENGTVPPLPRGFAGPVHWAEPIPGDVRLALRVNRITVFHGSTVEIRCVHGPSHPSGGAFAPETVEIELPIGLALVPPKGGGGGGGVGWDNATDVSALAGGGTVAAGYRRLRLLKAAHSEWSYMNIAVQIKTAVLDKALVGQTFTAARIRAYSGAAKNQLRSDNWQPLAITVKALVPAPLPKRLHTAFCWAGVKEFVDDRALGLSSLATWRALGFNTVPGLAGPGTLLNPANRSGSAWAGLKYGIMTSPFMRSPWVPLGSIEALTLKNITASQSTGHDGFNFSAVGIGPAEEKIERLKWRHALEFHSETGVMDMSYDGFFKQNDLATISKLVGYEQPDYFSMDIEAFPPVRWHRAWRRNSCPTTTSLRMM